MGEVSWKLCSFGVEDDGFPVGRHFYFRIRSEITPLVWYSCNVLWVERGLGGRKKTAAGEKRWVERGDEEGHPGWGMM